MHANLLVALKCIKNDSSRSLLEFLNSFSSFQFSSLSHSLSSLLILTPYSHSYPHSLSSLLILTPYSHSYPHSLSSLLSSLLILTPFTPFTAFIPSLSRVKIFPFFFSMRGNLEYAFIGICVETTWLIKRKIFLVSVCL